MAFYRACPRNFINGRKKSGAKKFIVLLDLTKRRYILSSKAKCLVKDNASISCFFSDISCCLAVKFNENTYKYFSCEKELEKLLEL